MSYAHFKRLPVKHIREKMKSRYKEKEPCYICGARENIELHHLYSVSELFQGWLRETGTKINNDEDVLACREQFISDYDEYLNNDNLYSLCKTHHLKLHSIYGKSYSNYMARKVRVWIERQREKHAEVASNKT